VERIDAPLLWLIRIALAAIAVSDLLLGRLSVAAPRRSIELYQRLMARFNWRVSPIDEARELRNTRGLGAVLLALSLVLLWLLL